MAAKGEKVKVDAEQQGEKLSNGDVVEATKLEPEVQASTVEKPSIEDRASTGAAPMNASTAPSAAPIITETLLNSGMCTSSDIAQLSHANMASVRDQDMKNLMMSWYYAGYYTGLYEGKQQGYASAMQQDG